MISRATEIDQWDSANAAGIRVVQRATYAVEAELTGFDGIPPLHESAEMIRTLDLSILGMYDGTQLVAIIGYSRSANTVDIDRMAVHPEYFRQGLAAALIEAVRTGEPDATRFEVSTGSANAPAIALYERRGFVIEGVEQLPAGIEITRLALEWDPYAPDRVAELLHGAPVRWWLSGGYALDRFAGRTIRPHGDIDISIATTDWSALVTHLGDGVVLWRPGAGHNVWLREPTRSAWRLQINLEPVVDGEWRYRRNELVRRPLAEVVLGGDEPYVNPAVQLLWKSAEPQPKDEQDFDAVYDALGATEQKWLAKSVAVAHPYSPWRKKLRRRT